MKNIKLEVKSVSLPSLASDFTLSYKNEYLRLLDMVPEGVTVVELTDLVNVINKLKAIDDYGILMLQDSEWLALKKRIESAKFNLVAPEVLDMCNAVIYATED